MKCTFCGKDFEEETITACCNRCALRWLTKSCGMICCPHCGYAIPREPRFIATLRTKWEERRHVKR